jgi:ribosomal protein L11 methyltransferase
MHTEAPARNMAWLQVETNIGTTPPETVETAMETIGAVAITLKDAGDHPLLEPAPGETPVWPKIVLTALFPADANQTAISAALGECTGNNDIRFSYLAEQDWQQRFEDELKPLQFGQRLWVIPDHTTTLPDNGVGVILPPGMAFGTGTHPTTAMCLEWLEGLDLQGQRVLDYGCGSGILGIAAVKLGAAQACLTDIDPQALQAATLNAAKNDATERLVIQPVEKTDNSVRFNILLANILSGTLIELGPILDDFMEPGADLAITGILSEQAEAVISAWSGWAEMSVSAQTRNWVLLTGKKFKAKQSEMED